MSPSRTYEQSLLAPIEALLATECSRFNDDLKFEARLQFLEAASSRIGTFSMREYSAAFNIASLVSWAEFDRVAAKIVALFASLPMHPSLALSALAREPMCNQTQREAGSYYTDFRLAMLVAELAHSVRVDGRPIIDPACGAGILLSALTLAVCGHDRKKAATWLSHYVHAADASSFALRGAALSLASFTDDVESVIRMRQHWYCGDTLLRPEEDWTRIAGNGYGCVIANPPWEKVKATRHEYAKANGAARHYGATHVDDNLFGYEDAQREASRYARELALRYPLIAGGEVDLYAAFTELFIKLAPDGGGIAALLPGGLIRSQSTEQLRRTLVDSCGELRIGVLDNKARFFGIDTRFKFLALAGRTKRMETAATDSLKELELSVYQGTPNDCRRTGGAKLPMTTLRELRGDLSIPEVRTQKEWQLYVSMSRAGTSWSDDVGPWRVHFCREVDMTRHRPNFIKEKKGTALPVVEGRMVQPHRFGAKTYVSGSGRAARWAVEPFGHSRVKPQFWIEPSALTRDVCDRVGRVRAGFCDIAGQTNERSMMAAVIPAGHVCGNKVPTVEFSGETAEVDMWLWLAFVNSFPFDWLLRRVLTTTVNYFLLRSVPLPSVTSSSLAGRRIVDAARELAQLDSAGSSSVALLRAAELRAYIDIAALQGYGRGFKDLQLILDDFPLLDRGQPTLPGESRSTITRDFLLLMAARRFNEPVSDLQRRVDQALALGAFPYVPSIAADGDATEVNTLTA